MEVRQATTDDVEGIRSVAERSWERDYPEIMSRETIREGVSEWYSEERLRTELDRDDTLILVAEEDGDVIGFSHAFREDDEVGDILRLYVDPDRRRRGVGTQLVERTRVALFGEGVERIRAMVLAENDLGNAFYRSHGFEKAGEDRTTIGDEEREETVYVTTRG